MNVKNEKEKEQCEFIVSKRGNVGFDHEFSKSSQILSTNPKPSPSLVYLYVLGSHFLSLSLTFSHFLETEGKWKKRNKALGI